MPKRIVNTTVMLQRDGRLVYPQVGQAFDFTDAELQSIAKSAPKALSKIIVPEAPVAVAVETKTRAVRGAEALPREA